MSSRTIITPENIGQITGKAWMLQEMTNDDNEYALVGVRPYLKFSSDGRVSGFASINRFSSSLQWDDQDRLQWPPFASTRMAGPLELMNQESAFLEALHKAQRLSVEGIHLQAQSDDGQVKLVFSSSP